MDRFDARTHAAIETLNQCHAMCLSMAMTDVLESHERLGRPQHMRMMLDCAAMCALTADLLAHKSQFHTRVCALCAEICDVCAQTCAESGMEDCARMCLRCSAVCEEAARLDHAEILAIASSIAPQ